MSPLSQRWALRVLCFCLFLFSHRSLSPLFSVSTGQAVNIYMHSKCIDPTSFFHLPHGDRDQLLWQPPDLCLFPCFFVNTYRNRLSSDPKVFKREQKKLVKFKKAKAKSLKRAILFVLKHTIAKKNQKVTRYISRPVTAMNYPKNIKLVYSWKVLVFNLNISWTSSECCISH